MMGTTLAVIWKVPSPSTMTLLVMLTLVMDTVGDDDADIHLVFSASWRKMGSRLKERARWSIGGVFPCCNLLGADE